jgi:hypothetical protein
MILTVICIVLGFSCANILYCCELNTTLQRLSLLLKLQFYIDFCLLKSGDDFGQSNHKKSLEKVEVSIEWDTGFSKRDEVQRGF